MMITTPQLVRRCEQHYAAIRTDVHLRDIPTVVPPLLPRLHDWLARQSLQPAGPVFFRYLSSAGPELVVEAGVPLSIAPPESGEVLAGRLPAGHYAVVLHTGHYSGLRAAHMALDSWGEHHGLRWQQSGEDCRMSWGCRLETYLNDPALEPDPDRWQTEIAFLIAGEPQPIIQP